ncbi:MAG: type I-MYXAN CRISPR-associated protein Cas6/Cmx6 [Spirochaetia bacterium]|nr:type I-MYXAN CRISPR-associated protein Cas6/Cmx6 [Spirochaetia bacterium]
MSFIEVKFKAIGKQIPADHGYLLYSALSRFDKKIHEMKDIAIAGISGMPDSSRNLHLSSASKLRIRLDHSDLPDVINLAGKELQIGAEKIRLGLPLVSMLKPHRHLYSRLVTIKGFQESEEFLASLQKQLDILQIKQTPMLFQRKSGETSTNIRKTLRIKNKEIVGFPVLITNLNPDESLRLQQVGLGGRRKMGCGTFVGVRA